MGLNKRISMVCYADDAAIFAETEDDLQKQLHKFCQVSQDHIYRKNEEHNLCYRSRKM